ncbi:hypothetical protein V1508DRAFT_427570 [Lipomyces doorenjongii]|uniref:uncharacterized protein n=1 Tax=Lipomyces doorenjongii TaxID=383834 RepID=UPI0034CD56EA
MRLESHWRILKRDYTSHLVRPRLDSLCYGICTGLVKSRLHTYANIWYRFTRPRILIARVSISCGHHQRSVVNYSRSVCRSSCSVGVTSVTRAVVTGEVSARALNRPMILLGMTW